MNASSVRFFIAFVMLSYLQVDCMMLFNLNELKQCLTALAEALNGPAYRPVEFFVDLLRNVPAIKQLDTSI
jgi:hypothetical protein